MCQDETAGVIGCSLGVPVVDHELERDCHASLHGSPLGVVTTEAPGDIVRLGGRVGPYPVLADGVRTSTTRKLVAVWHRVGDTPMDLHLLVYATVGLCGPVGLGIVATRDTAMARAAILSSTCGLEELCAAYNGLLEADGQLALDEGWVRRWTATWRFAGGAVVCPVRDLASMRTAGSRPVRRFTWRTGQRHRPGLQYLVSTGRHHGFESIAEQRLLLVLDFAGAVLDVLAQPFRLRYATRTGLEEHVPDFLAVTRDGGLLVDVRPGDRIGERDRVRFAAAAETALACGWRYVVVTGWRPHVLSNVDILSAQRRPLSDPLGVQGELLAAAGAPVAFGDLVAATVLPAVARAHALHLIWHRRLAIDLAVPLGDDTPVWAADIMRAVR